MKRILRYRPSGAMVVAIIALIVATAGTATAASLISGSRLRNGSLLAHDFKAGQVPAGPRGFTGPRGATGPAGHNGTNGFGVLVYPVQEDPALANGSSEDLEVDCPSGTFPTGGDAGAFDNANDANVGNQVIQNQFIAFDTNGNPIGYTAHFHNALPATDTADVFVDVVCANANQVFAKNKQHRHTARR
jgi:hypothetical protein